MPKTRAKEKHTQVSTELVERLRAFIRSERLQPGTKLPSERSLAADLNVGRPAIREAIKALQVLDLVDSRRGDGTYVKSLASLSGGWPSQVQVSTRNFDMLELLELRKMVEPQAASLAAARADTRQLSRIEKELSSQERSPNDRDVLQRYDFLFHEAIIVAAGNQVLVEVMRILTPLLLKSRQVTARTTPDVARVVSQHRRIFNAIRLGQSDLAEQAMKEHLQTVSLDLISGREGRA